MTHTLITTYLFIAGVIFGYNASDIYNFKSFCITFICSLFFVPIFIFYLFLALIELLYAKDIIFLIRILLGLIKEDRMEVLRSNTKKYVIRENMKTKGFIYRYLAKKVIKKYDL